MVQNTKRQRSWTRCSRFWWIIYQRWSNFTSQGHSSIYPRREHNYVIRNHKNFPLSVNHQEFSVTLSFFFVFFFLLLGKHKFFLFVLFFMSWWNPLFPRASMLGQKTEHLRVWSLVLITFIIAKSFTPLIQLRYEGDLTFFIANSELKLASM